MTKIGLYSIGLFLVTILIGATFATVINGEMVSDTATLEISDVRGGFGAVIVDVTNTGDVAAEGLSIITTVTGGIFNKINLRHQCSGCDMCGTALGPNMTKTESTREAGVLFGMGPIKILVSASASNAEEVTKEIDGFVVGPFVLI